MNVFWLGVEGWGEGQKKIGMITCSYLLLNSVRYSINSFARAKTC